MKRDRHFSFLLKALGATAFWLAVWLLVSLRVSNEFLFPSPLSVMRALVQLASTGDFWISTGCSLLRVMGGILVSLALGTLLAMLTEASRCLRTLLSPLLGVIKATPIASFIILALLWLDRNILPAFITALIVIPIVWSNVSEGLRSIDKELAEVTKVYNFTLLQRLKKLYIPSVAPFFTAACRSSLGMAWKAGISAEVLSTPQNAIGTELYYSKTYLETPSLFAWTLTVIVLSIVIEKLFVHGLERLGRHMHLIPKEEQNAQL